MICRPGDVRAFHAKHQTTNVASHLRQLKPIDIGFAHGLAESDPHELLEEKTETASYRIGLGHDTHQLADGGPLRLGGVEIPHDRHLVGHSDADVLLHAVTDALLGASSMGDIGEMFPNTDEANRGRDSATMLGEAFDAVRQAGFRVVNLDCIVFAESPKLSRFKIQMSKRIAGLLDVAPSQVGVKAKTGEGVGPVGESRAMMAECVVLLEQDV